MSQQIRFLEELKQDLLEHAPGRAEPVRPPRRPKLSGAWQAAAVFMGVLLVGGLTWVLRSGSPSVADPSPTMSTWDLSVFITPVDDTDGLLAQIDPIPGVVEAEYVPDIANLQPELTAGLNIAAVLIRIDAPENAESVATEINSRLDGVRVTYSEEIAAIEADAFFDFAVSDAVVLGGDPLILQPPPGPEPEFDLSGLGVELSMIPAQSADEIAETFLAHAQAPRMEEHALDPDRPVIHIGYLEEIDTRLIVYGTISNGYCAWVGTATGAGSSCGQFDMYPFGVVMVGSGSGGNDGDVSVRVPKGTSIVTLSIDGNEPQWQRPRAGWALFPMTVREPAQFTVEAYAADGSLIGHWDQSS